MIEEDLESLEKRVDRISENLTSALKYLARQFAIDTDSLKHSEECEEQRENVLTDMIKRSTKDISLYRASFNELKRMREIEISSERRTRSSLLKKIDKELDDYYPLSYWRTCGQSLHSCTCGLHELKKLTKPY